MCAHPPLKDESSYILITFRAVILSFRAVDDLFLRIMISTGCILQCSSERQRLKPAIALRPLHL
jgi:hypothetical protein